MELYQAILADLLAKGTLKFELPEINIEQALESHCYQALAEIKAVLTDNTLNDPECFAKIEEIIRIFEKIGCSCGTRHDFG